MSSLRRERNPGPSWSAPPPPLSVATSLVGLEAGALLLEGLSLLPSLHGERLAMGITSVAFFLIYGSFLAFAAWQLNRRRSWARAPVVLAQLIQILVGGSFWGGATTYVAVTLILVGLVVLAGIFHPASIAALAVGDD